jgi:acetyl/propionyl-CoA carboxylase alpha subunit
MFRKVLIANRGEIALRVVRACQELGVRTVAVYSDADARAPHVREADEAVHVGPSPSAQSYLVGERIIDAARRTGAEAVHPGYGFLSEREWFARAVRDAGLVWVGPPAEAIEAMGSKTAARQLAIRPARRSSRAPPSRCATPTRRWHRRAVRLPRAAQGGGRWGREGDARRARAGEMAAALGAAQREARNSFGDDAVYVEKYIEGPRHVEIQVLGDLHGTMLHLGRARVLGAAPAPEDDRGGAERGRHARAARAHGRGRPWPRRARRAT